MATVDAESILNEKKSFGAKVSDVRKKMKELRMTYEGIMNEAEGNIKEI